MNVVLDEVVNRFWRYGAALLAWGACMGLDLRGQDVSDVLPELRTLPAPASIAEGLRLNYYSTAANVPSTFYYEWRDADGWPHQDQMPGPAGHGYTQVDVLGLTPEWAALSLGSWGYHIFTGPLVPIGSAGQLMHAGGGDWWVHPHVLAGVAETLQPGLKILRMPQTVMNRTYQVLRIQRETDTSINAMSYDLETGYLVYKGGMVQGAEAVLLTQAFFAGSRQVRVPWSGAPLPGWVRAGTELRYEGTYSVVDPVRPLVLPLSALLRITGRADDWCFYDQTVTLESIAGMPPTVEKSTLATGVHHFSGLCLPVAALRQVMAGQRIDTDDVTRAVVDVAFVGTLDTGRAGVTFRFSIPHPTTGAVVSWSETSFDTLTGVAVRLRVFDGKSEFYQLETDMRLVELPPVVAPAPRLSAVWDPAAGTVRISCTTEECQSVTLRISTDGGRTWAVVPGFENRPCTGAPMTYELVRPTGSALFTATVR